MSSEIKQTRYSYLMLYVIAIVLAILGHIGIAILDGMGGVSYDYISTSEGTLFVQLLSIFSGAQLYGFMCAMALMCCTFLASVIMHGVGFSKDPSSASFGRTLLAGLVTAVVGFVCFGIIVSGLFSGVQLWGLKIQAPVTGGIIGMGIVALITLTTLVAAAIEVVCTCISAANDEKSLWVKLLIAAAVCGFIVVLLSVFTFNALNVAKISGAVGSLWFGVGIVINLAIMCVCTSIRKKGAADKSE